MTPFLKILIIYVVSTIKFLFAPAMSFGMGLNFLQTWLSTTAGGITGVFIFYFLSKWFIAIYRKRIIPYLKKQFSKLVVRTGIGSSSIHSETKPLSNFKGRNRLIVKAIRKYGLVGIVILTPVLLSIPVGTFVATRYYSENRYLLIYLSGSVLLWSLFMSSAISLF